MWNLGIYWLRFDKSIGEIPRGKISQSGWGKAAKPSASAWLQQIYSQIQLNKWTWMTWGPWGLKLWVRIQRNASTNSKGEYKCITTVTYMFSQEEQDCFTISLETDAGD